MAQDQPTTDEKFTCLVDGIKGMLTKAHEECDSREKALGSSVADNPRGDHSRMIASVHESRAAVKALKEAWHLAAGLYSGNLLPK